MWVNETDNGKQWCMAWMIVFQGSCQIEERTCEVAGEWSGSESGDFCSNCTASLMTHHLKILWWLLWGTPASLTDVLIISARWQESETGKKGVSNRHFLLGDKWLWWQVVDVVWKIIWWTLKIPPVKKKQVSNKVHYGEKKISAYALTGSMKPHNSCCDILACIHTKFGKSKVKSDMQVGAIALNPKGKRQNNSHCFKVWSLFFRAGESFIISSAVHFSRHGSPEVHLLLGSSAKVRNLCCQTWFTSTNFGHFSLFPCSLRKFKSDTVGSIVLTFYVLL